jgi:PAS domain S-box-containing protein
MTRPLTRSDAPPALLPGTDRDDAASFRAVFEHAIDAMLVADDDRRYVEVNGAASELLGVPRAQLVGRRIDDFVDAPPEALDAAWREFIAGRRTHGETRLRRADGTIRIVESRSKANILPGLHLATMRDVTDARDAESRLNLVLEATTLLGQSIDRDTTLDNLAHFLVPRLGDWCAVDLLDEQGVPRAVAIVHEDPAKIARGYELRHRYPPDPSDPCGLATVLRTGAAEIYPDVPRGIGGASKVPEHFHVARDRGVQSAMIVPLLVGGRTIGAITLLSMRAERRYDDVDLKLVEKLASRAALAIDNAALHHAAKVQAERLRIVSEASRAFAEEGLALPALLDKVASYVAQAVGDACSVRLRSEDGGALLHGARSEPLAPARDERACGAPTPPCGVDGALLADVIGAGRTVRVPIVDDGELRSMLPVDARAELGGSRIHSLIVAPLRFQARIEGTLSVWRAAPGRPYPAEDERLVGELATRAALAIEAARIFQREERARREAELAARAREDFMAILAHDLRNPLGTVSLGSALLLRSTVGHDRLDPIHDQAGRIYRAAERMEAMIRNLLDAATVESGQLPIEAAPVRIDALVNDAIDMMTLAAHERSITLEKACACDDARIRGDHGRVLQVFSNLIGNALRFTPAGGTVAVRAELADGCARLTVHDSGCGIDPRELPFVFDRFWKGKDTARGGTGLGLYIAKGIVEAHGGVITVASEPGAGAVFTFTLPFA